MEMPKAHADPQYAAWLHGLKMACDTFINMMRAIFDQQSPALGAHCKRRATALRLGSSAIIATLFCCC